LVKPTFFATAEELREWLERNHATATELLVGFYRRGSGRPSITWQELVDEELCFGWIDGIRKGIDAVSYANRITPRKPRSTWSAINTKREETRKKRLQTLIHDSQNGRTVGPLSRPVGSRQRIVPVKTAMTMATPSRRKKTPATGRQVDPK
jgi:uncharacterized protein YdeI (YjbR/CyaY-like superfamily)